MKDFKRINSHLPLFVAPKRDEILTSWLARNALSHKIKYVTFLQKLFNDRSFYFRDLDLFLNNKCKNIILQKFPISVAELDEMLLSSYIGYLTNSSNLISNSLVIKLGPVYNRHKINKLLYCPLCLKEEPFFRKKWRLSYSFVCTKHNVFLKDHCTYCKSPVLYTRQGIGLNVQKLTTIDQCFNCLKPLSESYITNCDSIFIPGQIYFEDILSKGYTSNLPYSFQFYEGVIDLISLLQSNRIKPREFTKKMWSHFQFNRFPKRHMRTNFSFMPLNDRREIIRSVYYLLNDWPDSFISIANETGLTRSYFLHEKKKTVFWIHKELDQINKSYN